ncbi:hypothetical protein [Flavobacterium terrigena]|uniref:Uncharacterized protein n=1 Tax=Flavobacterium terrigena TaxID=402734 RepID=A0A1H6VK93_9FLAO|nr:hypothetical protein [Flavobacterium terrigena]SEJ00752.1 hypothetical protein SAMN05660918_2131 [Flavobacterium terrigena]
MKKSIKFFALIPLFVFCQEKITNKEITIINKATVSIDSIVVIDGVKEKISINDKILPNKELKFILPCIDPVDNGEGQYFMKIYKDNKEHNVAYCVYDWSYVSNSNEIIYVKDDEITKTSVTKQE